jgi:hypothetical protein
MNKAITEEERALLKETSEMFDETGCVLALMERKCQLKG